MQQYPPARTRVLLLAKGCNNFLRLLHLVALSMGLGKSQETYLYVTSTPVAKCWGAVSIFLDTNIDYCDFKTPLGKNRRIRLLFDDRTGRD